MASYVRLRTAMTLIIHIEMQNARAEYFCLRFATGRIDGVRRKGTGEDKLRRIADSFLE